jgi:ubiquinone/menaquinone biosynthesis C-methylase UbiE
MLSIEQKITGAIALNIYNGGSIMNENIKKDMGELMNSLGEAWKGALISAGFITGIFDILDTKDPTPIEKLIKDTGFDKEKLQVWLYSMEFINLIQSDESGYLLTSKGSLLNKKSDIKDLYGLMQLTQFYMQAALQAKDTFKPGESLDKLSEGKISRDYQPRVSDNFSAALVHYLNDKDINGTDTLMDIGCGRGSFLRYINRMIPDLQMTGMDSNLFAIQKGKEDINKLNISNKIKLIVGDVTADLGDIKENSYDWITAINVFHFIKPENRIALIENMIRIAKKGVIMTQVVIETTLLSATANPLMFLLWNDYTGFFKENDLHSINEDLKKKYKQYTFDFKSIMQGNSFILSVIK